jgi:predicted nucleic acid-binding protein
VSEFVDANIFVRLLARDDDAKYRRCRALLERAGRGDIQLVTSESIVAEVVYILASPALYRTPRPVLAASLRTVLGNRGLEFEHKGSVLRALTLYETTSLYFADCLATEHVRRLQLNGIYSYDRDFDRVPGVTRLEP